MHSPMDFAKTLKLRFRVGDLDLPVRRERYTSSRAEEVDAQMCPYGKAIASRFTQWENVKCTRRSRIC